jgi:hypothetical protein
MAGSTRHALDVRAVRAIVERVVEAFEEKRGRHETPAPIGVRPFAA